jgi:hypothetical protein
VPANIVSVFSDIWGLGRSRRGSYPLCDEASYVETAELGAVRSRLARGQPSPIVMDGHKVAGLVQKPHRRQQSIGDDRRVGLTAARIPIPSINTL